jgi:uncharacterized protein DUF4824
MRRATLLAAVAIVLVANTFALLHAWRNRSGPVEAEITLTQRELPLSYNSNDEDTGIRLDFRWTDPSWSLFGLSDSVTWLDQSTLHNLGFDTRVAPSDEKANEFYQRQRARRAFVAFEYDGAAWRKHLELAERADRERAELTKSTAVPNLHVSEAHLVALDASTDAALLRARHPDRTSVIIVPVVVGINVRPFVAAVRGAPSRPASLYGTVREVPSSIHVPLPFSEAFRRLPKDRSAVSYRVRLRYGASFEPWIAAVEVPTPTRP